MFVCVCVCVCIWRLMATPKATIISCYSPTNVSEENEIATFYEDLSSLVRSIPKHTTC